MANGYTAVPAIIPGNLTVNGTLTINNDCGIILGSANPRVRLFKNITGGASLSSNLGCDSTTRDTGATPAWELHMNPGDTRAFLRFLTAAGTQVITDLDRTFAQDGNIQTNTGNANENVMHSKLIPGNTLGQDGAFIIEWLLAGNVQGGVATTFRVKFGGTAIVSFVKAATANILVRVFLTNENLTNQQTAYAMVADSVAGVALLSGTTVKDTTADQTLQLTIQNGAAGDSWNDGGWKVHGLVTVQQAV